MRIRGQKVALANITINLDEGGRPVEGEEEHG